MDNKLGRRDALRLLAAATSGIAAGCGADDGTGTADMAGSGAQCAAGAKAGADLIAGPGATKVPMLGSVPVNVPSIGTVYMCRDEKGLFAVDSRCTHNGCATDLTQDGMWVCPCHTSRFTYRGQLIDGPARSSMNSYSVCTLADGSTLIKINT